MMAWTSPSDTSTSMPPVTRDNAGKKELLSVRSDHQSVLTVTGHESSEPSTLGQRCMCSDIFRNIQITFEFN